MNHGRQEAAPLQHNVEQPNASIQSVPREQERSDDGSAGQAAADKLALLHSQAMLAGMSEGWKRQPPKTVIERLVNRLPEVKQPLADRTALLMPPDEPSPLSLYFLSHIPDLNLPIADVAPKGTLNTLGSIECLADEVRTKYFVRAIGRSIDRIAATTEGTIEVLDAGTGAVPLLGIYAALCSDRVRCTALELNPVSALIAQKIVKNMGLAEKVKIRQADATTYIPEQPVDVLISETMHSGLTSEPLVQIMSNLQPYVRPNGLVLPSAVKVLSALVDVDEVARPSQRMRMNNAPYPITQTAMRQVALYLPGDELPTISFMHDLPTELAKGYMVQVCSEVHIGDDVLRPFQSLISMPRYVQDRAGLPLMILPGRANSVEVNYAPGDSLVGVADLH